MTIKHPFAKSKAKYLSGKFEYQYLLLGTFPSEKSRESGFFYGNPQNAFWKVLGEVFGENLSALNPVQKEKWLDGQGIALYDLIDEYEGESWYSNDRDLFLKGREHKYCRDFVTTFAQKFPQAKIGGTSREVETKFRQQFCSVYPKEARKDEVLTKLEIFYLPSPSPLNTNIIGEERIKKWREFFDK